MIKVEVIGEFTLSKFNELKNIERANPNKNEDGHLYVNDKFECNEEMVRYLGGENKDHKAYVKIIEVIPEEKLIENKIEETKKDEEKPRRKKKLVAKD